MKAVVLSLVCLTVFATSASAEGAWVMWSNLTDRFGNKEWRPATGASSEQACLEIILSITPDKVTSEWSDAERVTVDGNTITTYFRDGSKTTASLICFPDTIDPR